MGMLGLTRLKRAVTMVAQDNPLASVPFSIVGKTHGAVIAPNLTESEAQTLMVVLDQLREERT